MNDAVSTGCRSNNVKREKINRIKEREREKERQQKEKRKKEKNLESCLTKAVYTEKKWTDVIYSLLITWCIPNLEAIKLSCNILVIKERVIQIKYLYQL